MVIKKEILNNFIKKLKKNKDFPKELTSTIEKVWDLDKDLSKEEIKKIIMHQNDNKD